MALTYFKICQCNFHSFKTVQTYILVLDWETGGWNYFIFDIYLFVCVILYATLWGPNERKQLFKVVNYVYLKV